MSADISARSVRQADGLDPVRALQRVLYRRMVGTGCPRDAGAKGAGMYYICLRWRVNALGGVRRERPALELVEQLQDRETEDS